MDPSQGSGETLEILAGLIVLQQDPKDVWILVRAKQANFDTGCGFDIQHLFAAGVATTLVYVRSSTHPKRDNALGVLLNEDGTPALQEQDVQAWLATMPVSLPTDSGERARVWFDRALDLGMVEAAQGFLNDWLQGRSRDPETLCSLAYHLELLERWQQASDTRKELFPQWQDPFEKAGAAREIARLERKAGKPCEAERWLVLAANLHAKDKSWTEIGLGREFVEECFRCAAALGVGKGESLFSMAVRFAKVTPRLAPVTLQAADEAAEIFRNSRYTH
jgi:hypothetical protein